MSPKPAWSLSTLLDRVQAAGEAPVVNPTKKPRPVPLVTGRDAAWLFVFTLAVLWLILLTGVVLSGENAPFIYSEF